MTTEKLLEWFLFCCVNLLPELALIIISCRGFLRFTLKNTILLSMGVLVWYFGCIIASEVGIISYMTLNFMLNAVYILFGILLTRGKPWQLLFALCIVLNYGSICAISSGGILSAFGLSNLMFGWQDSLITLGIAAFLWFLYYGLLIGRIQTLFAREDTDNIWRVLWLVPALFCIIHYFCIWTQDGQFSTHIVNVVFLAVINIGSVFVSYLVAQFVDDRLARQRIETDNQRLFVQAAQYENLKQRMDETRKARHDLKQHLRLIQSYLDTKDNDALSDYINKYSQTLPKDNNISYCKNNTVDTIVRFYAEQAEAVGIKFETKLNLDNDLNISEPDICVLLGNLLENAVEESKKQLAGSPVIKIGGQLVGSKTLVITVDNSPASKPEKKNSLFISTKHDNFGIGTQSIQDIAKKYNGEARFEWKENTFYASVVMNLGSEIK